MPSGVLGQRLSPGVQPISEAAHRQRLIPLGNRLKGRFHVKHAAFVILFAAALLATVGSADAGVTVVPSFWSTEKSLQTALADPQYVLELPVACPPELAATGVPAAWLPLLDSTQLRQRELQAVPYGLGMRIRVFPNVLAGGLEIMAVYAAFNESPRNFDYDKRTLEPRQGTGLIRVPRLISGFTMPGDKRAADRDPRNVDPSADNRFVHDIAIDCKGSGGQPSLYPRTVRYYALVHDARRRDHTLFWLIHVPGKDDVALPVATIQWSPTLWTGPANPDPQLVIQKMIGRGGMIGTPKRGVYVDETSKVVPESRPTPQAGRAGKARTAKILIWRSDRRDCKGPGSTRYTGKTAIRVTNVDTGKVLQDWVTGEQPPEAIDLPIGCKMRVEIKIQRRSGAMELIPFAHEKTVSESSPTSLSWWFFEEGR